MFGHELVGKVAFAGENTGFFENERVTFNPNITPHRTTGFAEYFFISGFREELTSAIIRIPEDISLSPPWSPEPFSATIRSLDVFLKHANKQDLQGVSVAIIGAGVAGSLIAMYAKYYGAEVTLFNRGQMRLDFLVQNEIFTINEVALLSEMTSRQDAFDVVYVVPTKIEQEHLNHAFKVVKPNGYISLYGGTRASDTFLDSNVDIDQIRRNETKYTFEYQSKNITLTGAYGQTKRDYERGFELFMSHHDFFPLEKLVSKQISFTEFPEVIMKMAKGTLDFPGKVLVNLIPSPDQVHT